MQAARPKAKWEVLKTELTRERGLTRERVAEERVAEERVEGEQVEGEQVEVQLRGLHLAVQAQVAMKAETDREILQSKPLPRTGTTRTTTKMVKPDCADAKLASNQRWRP